VFPGNRIKMFNALLDTSLLGMWQVLEKLTGTDRYDLLIDRLVRLFRDPEEAREIANHVRLRRNQTVHSAHNISSEAHSILLQVETLASQAIFCFASRMLQSLKTKKSYATFSTYLWVRIN
jgi:hypothetical protein